MQSTTERLLTQFKALADPVRMRVVAICAHGECSVSELTQVLALSQPRVSQHLKQLCAAGLLERFRDGQFAYYRVPSRGDDASTRRRLLALLPADEPAFGRDVDRLREVRGVAAAPVPEAREDADDRRLHRALVALTVTAPLGDLLDIGSGRGRLLKLLASRARRVVGVDIDADARQFARAELLLAGVANASLRKGNMYALPFEDQEFDTVILDDTLGAADEPVLAVCEARRLLKPGGRIILLAEVADGESTPLERLFAGWCRTAGLRLSAPQRVPRRESRWLLAVATPADAEVAAA
jgi:ArsR family transcriptional regulator